MSSSSPSPVVILCGGLGLRLRPVVSDKPKCLAPVGGRPFLEWLIANLRLQGFTKIVLCLGYGSDQVLEFAATGALKQVQISHVVETQALGTAGALRHASPLIAEDQFLALNGDTILGVNLNELLQFREEHDALAAVALVRNSQSLRSYGGADIDSDGRIVTFTARSDGSGEGARRKRSSPFINGGVYAFAREIFERIPGPSEFVSLERDVFPSLVGQRLYGFPCDGYFLDIGIPGDYARAQAELPERFKLW